MPMEVHLYGLDDEYIGSSDIEVPQPDFLDWNGRMFRKSMECDNEYIQVSYVSMADSSSFMHVLSFRRTSQPLLEPANWPRNPCCVTVTADSSSN